MGRTQSGLLQPVIQYDEKRFWIGLNWVCNSFAEYESNQSNKKTSGFGLSQSGPSENNA